VAIATSVASGSSGSGRRANRTRFTDFQLRTLQDFFDKQGNYLILFVVKKIKPIF
jgi:acetaldehyde dehydrogenase (acetylating)